MVGRKRTDMRTEDALKRLGVHKAELARKLGITRSAVTQWGEFVPVLMQYRIEDIRRGRRAHAEVHR